VTRTPTIAVIGAGFAGIGAAGRLRQAGFHDVVILERGGSVGGTWRENTYPGVACDIPAHLYSYSFAPKADWSTAYPRQAEIQDYLEQVTDRYRLRPYLRLHTEVVSARFDEPAARWRLRTRDGGEYVADAVVAALGPLRDPSYPSFEGRDEFRGVQLHTARWDHDVDLDGKRIGVIGTGSSGVQVVPPLADRAAHVTVFQRSAPWIIPLLDRTYSDLEIWLFENVPAFRWLYRELLYWQKEVRFAGFKRGSPAMRLMESYARWNLRRHIDDPELRRKLTPDYRMGCKRIILSNRYYPTLARDHVDVVTDPIATITPDGIRTGAGDHLPFDVIVYATGFRVADPLGEATITGLDGRDLDAAWGSRPAAHLGTTVPGFPNLFLLLGPNTGLGHNSMVFMLESQYNYVVDALERLRDPEVAYLDVREDALADFQREVTRRNQRTVWASGCHSWYLSDDGYNFTLWPGYTFEYWHRTRRFDPDSYRLVAPPRAHRSPTLTTTGGPASTRPEGGRSEPVRRDATGDARAERGGRPPARRG
jgi:cation diffusion facilitator CzcD-associated flavoprotein CzcO